MIITNIIHRSDILEVLNEKGLTEKEFLNSYNPDKYKKPSVAVDMLVFTITSEEEKNYRKLPKKELKILMIKRKNHPYIGHWVLPGGFVNIDEDLDTAAYRELKEETGIENVYMEQLYTWGGVRRDPRMRVLSGSYLSLIDSSELEIKAGDDAADAKWFSIRYNVYQEQKTMTEKGYCLEKLVRITLESDEDKLFAVVRVSKNVEGKITSTTREIVESSGIGFDHSKIIGYGVERLRNKIEYTDIAFSLMPDLFALTELQKVYEIILDRELLTANFRRKIAGMVIETNEYSKDAGHRPSKLYRFNPNWEERIF